MTPNKKHDDTKILLIVAGAVVTGAAGLALLAGWGGSGAEPTVPARAAVTPQTPVEEPTTAQPAVFVGSREADPVIETASLSNEGDSRVAAEIAAGVLDERGDLSNATATFEIAPGENLVAGGLEAWKSRDFHRAVAYFRAQTEARDSDAWAHYMLGLSLWKLDKSDEAARSMRRSAELDPTFIRTPINLSRIENDRGDFQAALAAAEAAVALDGDDAEARFLEGRSWSNLGRTDAARVALERSIALDDANGYVHNVLGLTLLAQGDADAAVGALERAVELEPDVAFIHNNLGMALEHGGDREGAVAAYQRAMELGDGYAKAARNLARLQPATQESPGEAIATVQEPEESPSLETADGAILN